MKMPKISLYALAMIVFLTVISPCEADGDRSKNHGRRDRERHGGKEHHHHDHRYRWFGVIPRPAWAPYSGYYYAVPQYVVPMPSPVQTPNVQIGVPVVRGVPQESETIIVVPQQHQSFQDGQKPIYIPMPQDSVLEPIVPQPQAPRSATLRRIDPSKATTIEKYVIGEAACPLDLPKGGIIRVCNARSGKYKLSGQGDEKYFHQQECWFCENILGGDYVRWQDHMQ